MRSQTLGSTLLIAGTCIGAGMLALPLVTAATGFWSGLLLMLLMWGLAAYGGLLIAEACRACPESENLHGMVGILLGKTGQTLAVFAMLFLYYSLCAAYISGGASQLVNILERSGIELPFWQSATFVTIIVAAVVVVGTVMVDYCNRVMFLLMLVLLAFILMLLLPDASIDNMVVEGSSSGILLAAMPVLYTSFGFHCAVPTVVQYVDGRPRKFRKALLLGSVLPFIIYALWQMATNGVLPPALVQEIASGPDAVSRLTLAVGEASHFSGFNNTISFFAAFALGTSFLGVALGLFDYLAEFSHRAHNLSGRIQTVLLTLVIPLLAAIFAPGSFILALGYAAVALVVLAIFLPVAMVWKVRKLHMEEPYQVAGGVPGLVLASLGGAVVILAQLGIATGLLPAIG
ncbi:MAG: aromatic amino acid transport family protein [Endozoicomonas sp.]